MDLETLFTSSKWEILSLLSKRSASPLEISQELKTTIANVSQQLRLLEFAGLVTKVRLPNRDAGKPRLVYSVAHNFAYILVVHQHFSGKRMLALTDRHAFFLRAWLIEHAEVHYYLEQLYYRLEPLWSSIEGVAVGVQDTTLHVYVITQDKKEFSKKFDNEPIKKTGSSSMHISLHPFLSKEIEKNFSPKELSGPLHILFDPLNLFLIPNTPKKQNN